MTDAAIAAFPGTNGTIAFVNSTGAAGSSMDIAAFDPGGQGRIVLTNTPEDDAFPSYSADGKRIAFSRSPAGAMGEGQIWVMNADGTGQEKLTSPAAGAEDHDPSFSPDGKQIVFTHEDATGNQIWITNADGSGQKPLTVPGASGDRGSGPVFSPNGQKIVFVHFRGAIGFHNIALMNPDGSGITDLGTPSASADDFQPDISPDGQRIVFDRYNQTQDDLYVMNVDGSGVAPLADSATDLDLSPVFAPDGTKVAFERDAPGFAFANIALADSSGLNQNIVLLTANAAPVQDFQPAWQPVNGPACELGGDETPGSIKKLTMTVTCLESAKVSVKGFGKAPGASKATKFAIAPVKVDATANVSTKLKLKISKDVQQVLAAAADAGKSAKAKITAKATDDLGRTSNDSLSVAFKP